ncbi:hypothetical protein IGI04_011316, partial [Brassica rapa subsp. trilocularis]
LLYQPKTYSLTEKDKTTAAKSTRHSPVYSCAAEEVSSSGSMVGALVATSDWFTDGSQGLQTMTETEEDVETCGGVRFRTELKQDNVKRFPSFDHSNYSISSGRLRTRFTISLFENEIINLNFQLSKKTLQVEMLKLLHLLINSSKPVVEILLITSVGFYMAFDGSFAIGNRLAGSVTYESLVNMESGNIPSIIIPTVYKDKGEVYLKILRIATNMEWVMLHSPWP